MFQCMLLRIDAFTNEFSFTNRCITKSNQKRYRCIWNNRIILQSQTYSKLIEVALHQFTFCSKKLKLSVYKLWSIVTGKKNKSIVNTMHILEYLNLMSKKRIPTQHNNSTLSQTHLNLFERTGCITDTDLFDLTAGTVCESPHTGRTAIDVRAQLDFTFDFVQLLHCGQELTETRPPTYKHKQLHSSNQYNINIGIMNIRKIVQSTTIKKENFPFIV